MEEARPYMGFFYDDYLDAPVFDSKFDKSVIARVLQLFLESYNPEADSTAWFENVKSITQAVGLTTDMKAYKADPTAFPGTVADVSGFLRIDVTGKTNSPDLYTVMQILGQARTAARIRAALAQL